jgi:hypothetical protein
LDGTKLPLISNDFACADAAIAFAARHVWRGACSRRRIQENNGMPLFTSLMMIFLIGCTAPRFAQAQQANSCKQCSDQRHACSGGYSAKTCQVEYERCMKNCQRK